MSRWTQIYYEKCKYNVIAFQCDKTQPTALTSYLSFVYILSTKRCILLRRRKQLLCLEGQLFTDQWWILHDAYRKSFPFHRSKSALPSQMYLRSHVRLTKLAPSTPPQRYNEQLEQWTLHLIALFVALNYASLFAGNKTQTLCANQFYQQLNILSI